MILLPQISKSMKTAKLLYTQVLEKAQQISAPQNDYDINFLIKVGLGIIILLTIGFALYQWYRKSQKARNNNRWNTTGIRAISGSND